MGTIVEYKTPLTRFGGALVRLDMDGTQYVLRQSVDAKVLFDNIRKLAGGTIFTIATVKRENGAYRVFNCRLNVKKGTTGEGMAYNPREKHVLPVYDLQIARTGKQPFRNVNLDEVRWIKIRGQEIDFR